MKIEYSINKYIEMLESDYKKGRLSYFKVSGQNWKFVIGAVILFFGVYMGLSFLFPILRIYIGFIGIFVAGTLIYELFIVLKAKKNYNKYIKPFDNYLDELRKYEKIKIEFDGLNIKSYLKNGDKEDFTAFVRNEWDFFDFNVGHSIEVRVKNNKIIIARSALKGEGSVELMKEFGKIHMSGVL